MAEPKLIVYRCPECGEKAERPYGPNEERGHYHDNPDNPNASKRIWHPAVPAEVFSEAQFRERMTSDEAVKAMQTFLFPGTEYAGREEYPSLLGAMEAALDAAFPDSSTNGDDDPCEECDGERFVWTGAPKGHLGSSRVPCPKCQPPQVDEKLLEALDEAIARRREDPEFMGRIRASVDENAEVLNRLASGEEAGEGVAKELIDLVVGAVTYPRDFARRLVENDDHLQQSLGHAIARVRLATTHPQNPGGLSEYDRERLRTIAARGLHVSIGFDNVAFLRELADRSPQPDSRRDETLAGPELAEVARHEADRTEPEQDGER